MCSNEDFERLFIRYKGEVYPKGESIQTFCHRNNGLHLRQGNLSYGQLKRLVEKLEDLC